MDELDFLLFHYQQDAVGSSVMALIFLIFEFSVAMARMKASKFLLAALVSFVVQRYACQLLLGTCQLTLGMFTFTFYELESLL